MIEKPYEGRAEVISDGINLLIKIPSKKNWLIILFLTFWLGGWILGESTAIYTLLSNESIGANSFILFWLFGWSIGGLFVIMILLWNLFGQETIQIDRGILTISKGILNILQFKKNYDLSSIKNLELNPEPSEIDNYFGRNKKLSLGGFTGGKIRFDYGMKTIKFGLGIDEAEARYLIDEIVKQGFNKKISIPH